MASLYCSLETRPFLALLRGLNKRLFQDNSNDMTIEFLYSELYAGVDGDAGIAQIRSYEDILARAAAENWDVARLEAEATKLGGISAEQLGVLLAYWGSERLTVGSPLMLTSSFHCVIIAFP
jgi:hypothetical protein